MTTQKEDIQFEESIDFTQGIDFSSAKYTAVMSDFHLCEAEPVNQRHPLWKKFKTREFFFDEEFEQTLKNLIVKADGNTVELVLNGDIFDFDSFTGLPEHPSFNISWLEELRGLDTEREKSVYKINCILEDHPVFVRALSEFVKAGHKLIFVIGNHDLELNWREVQKAITDSLGLSLAEKRHVRFAEWFYISNGDTLIEHGHQYDPYCCSENPINPFVIDYNRTLVRLPFGDFACKYLSNGVGFFNPHVDSNYTMSLGQYTKVFFKYMFVAQPFIVWTWFWSSVTIFIQTIRHAIFKEVNNPLTIEDRIDEIARKSNATSRMVREMHQLTAHPVSESPWKLLKELWLDRAFLLFIGLFATVYIFLIIDQILNISTLWLLLPFVILLPPYFLYSKSVQSRIHFYKKPSEQKLFQSSLITGTRRVVYGHTHIIRHEVIGVVEHLNPGTWSPGFTDVECTSAVNQRAYIWIEPSHKDDKNVRQARVVRVV